MSQRAVDFFILVSCAWYQLSWLLAVVLMSCDVQAARVFESQLADSLLEGDGQLAFKKLAAATVETLMPKIETKGEFGQARWRLVSAPQVPNLLSLDPTTDPFKSLANLSFGAEVEVQLGKHLQVPTSTPSTGWRPFYSRNRSFLHSLNSQFGVGLTGS